MKSRTTARFRQCLAELPLEIRRQARDAYRRFSQDPGYPGLHFKKVHAVEPIYSARISRDYRALGVQTGDEIVWFWIGSHADYEHMLSAGRRK